MMKLSRTPCCQMLGITQTHCMMVNVVWKLLVPESLPIINTFIESDCFVGSRVARLKKAQSVCDNDFLDKTHSLILRTRPQIIHWISKMVKIKARSSIQGLRSGSDGKEIWLQCRRSWFYPWVRNIPWRREWQPTPVFLPGQSPMDRGAW